MAGDWIKMRTDLEDDPAVISIAAAVSIDPLDIVGRLHKFWSWADKHTTDGNAAGVTGAWVDGYVRVNGFAAAMVKMGWLDLNTEGLSIPKFDSHNSESAKQRALTAKRATNHRNKSNANSNASSVTEPLLSALPREEKNREEKRIGGKPPITPVRSRIKTTSILPDGFKRFWDSYPPSRAVDRARALQAWARHGCEEIHEAIIVHITAWKASGRWDDVQFCPNVTTYLNQRRWESPPPAKDNANGQLGAKSSPKINPFTGKEIP